MNTKLSVALVVATAVLSGGSLVFARGMSGESMLRGSAKLEETAKVLGVTTDDLKTQLKAGKTIQEVATVKGVSEAQLQEAFHAHMMGAQKTRLAQLVKNGNITQAQADAQLQWMSDHHQWLKDHPAPLGGSKGSMMGGRGKGGMGMHGWKNF